MVAGAAIVPRARVGWGLATHRDGSVSKARHTMFATIYPPGNATFSTAPPIKKVRAAIQKAAPPGVTTHLTGSAPIIESQGEAGGPSVLTETLIGGAGALVILTFDFWTIPAL